MTLGSTSAPVLGGLALAAIGVAHFVAPQLFYGITKLVYPDDIQKWTLRNGAAETAIGLAIAVPRERARHVRTVGLIGLAAYGVQLGRRAVAVR